MAEGFPRTEGSREATESTCPRRRPVEGAAGGADREQRLDPRRAARDERDRARGRDRRHGGVPPRSFTPRVPERAGPGREGAAPLRELAAGRARLALEEGRDPL